MTFRFGPARNSGAYSYGVGSLGLLGSQLAGAGTHGMGIFRVNDGGVTLPAEANDEFTYRIVTAPPLLTLFLWYSDGGLEGEGPVGTHQGTYEAFKNGASYGQNTFSFFIGVLGTLTGGIAEDDDAPSGVLSPAPVPPAPPPPTFQPSRAVKLAYSVLDLSAQPDLTAKDPSEIITLYADFAPFASVSNPTWSFTRLGGDDGTPVPTVQGTSDVQGSKVYQKVQGGFAGNTYSVRCQAQGPNGEVLVASGHLPVRVRA